MFRVAAVLLLALALSGCGKPSPKDAVPAVQGFLAAAETGDAARFEAALDRDAVRADLRRQLVEVAQANGVEVDGGPSDRVLDRMIGPEAVNRMQAVAGARGAGPQALVGMLKSLAGGQVCLHDADQTCLLTFARQKAAQKRPAAWRLVGMLYVDPAGA
jgi:hypothetical protein